jgi:anti-sigma factor ChrR (cupin superfamily)
MDCARSIELLSEYKEGNLDTDNRIFVNTHLSICSPCKGVFEDLEAIVNLASEIHASDIPFPDENLLWRQLVSKKNILH